MRTNHSAPARRRALLLAMALLAVSIPVAEAANQPEPESQAKRPYVVVSAGGGKGQSMAKDHGRRFGVKPDRIFDRVGGYRAEMTDRQAKELDRQPGVVVAEDTVVQKNADAPSSPELLSGQPAGYSSLPSGWGWNLDRIDQTKSLSKEAEKTRYHYSETANGVTAYVIDSGVNIDHVEFGGRARVGFDALGGNGLDCDGHGTHVAGTIGGKTFGVAKDVDIVAVRVLDCNGSGYVSQVVNGINWVTANAAKPAVANMSLGGGKNDALDQAVRNSIASGVTYAVAAGNSNRDACNESPSRVKEAIVVGATDSSDRRASYSNYGSTCVDVYAPGSNVTSAVGASSNTAWTRMSGTSMASPAVAGVVARLLDVVPDAKPPAVAQALLGLATAGVVTGTNTTGAKLLFAPWADADLGRASCQLGVASACSTPPPPTSSTTAPAPTTTTKPPTTTTTTKPPTTTTTRPPTTTTTRSPICFGGWCF
jgi:subtilisin family serine protease